MNEEDISADVIVPEDIPQLTPEKKKKYMMIALLVAILMCGIYGGFTYGYREAYIYVDGWYQYHERYFCMCFNESKKPEYKLNTVDASSFEIK